MAEFDPSDKHYRPIDIDATVSHIGTSLRNKRLEKPVEDIREVVVSLAQAARITTYIPQLAEKQLRSASPNLPQQPPETI